MLSAAPPPLANSFASKVQDAPPLLVKPAQSQAGLGAVASLSLASLLDSPESTAVAIAVLVMLCCCVFCFAANRCAAGKEGGGETRRAPARRGRTAGYDRPGDFDDDADELGDLDDYDDELSPRGNGGGPAVRVVRVGTKPHPPTRMGGRFGR